MIKGIFEREGCPTECPVAMNCDRALEEVGDVPAVDEVESINEINEINGEQWRVVGVALSAVEHCIDRAVSAEKTIVRGRSYTKCPTTASRTEVPAVMRKDFADDAKTSASL